MIFRSHTAGIMPPAGTPGLFTAINLRRLAALRKADAGGSLPQRVPALASLHVLPVRLPQRGTPAPSGDLHWRPIAIEPASEPWRHLAACNRPQGRSPIARARRLQLAFQPASVFQ